VYLFYTADAETSWAEITIDCPSAGRRSQRAGPRAVEVLRLFAIVPFFVPEHLRSMHCV